MIPATCSPTTGCDAGILCRDRISDQWEYLIQPFSVISSDGLAELVSSTTSHVKVYTVLLT